MPLIVVGNTYFKSPFKFLEKSGFQSDPINIVLRGRVVKKLFGKNIFYKLFIPPGTLY